MLLRGAPEIANATEAVQSALKSRSRRGLTPTSRVSHESAISSVTSPRSKVDRGEAQLFLTAGVVVQLFYVGLSKTRNVELSKTRKEDPTMRLVILTAAAALVITGTAMANESVQTNVKGARHHHYREANASVASVPADSIPADTLSAHETRVKNLRDSGYNPARDFNAAGNVATY
jgi:hypothetical protein